MAQILRIVPLALLIFLFATPCLQAWHIAGAQLRYECLGQNADGSYRYRIDLTLYRDCSLDGINDPNIRVADYDNLIYLYVFTSDPPQRYRIVEVEQPADTPSIKPNALLACFAIPPKVCLQEGTYTTIISLPPREGGYDIAWARCCRNQNVRNLANSRMDGVTFLAHVPGTESAPCNNMSRFTKQPPLFICRNALVDIDFNAIDADGDSLVYRLTHPFQSYNTENLGANQQNPAIGYRGTNGDIVHLGPPPYRLVNFANGYDAQRPFGLQGICKIDEKNGMLSVNPQEEGMFVLAVSVFEYRNGVLLCENKFDLQVHVIPCEPKGKPPVLEHLLSENTQSGAEVNGDTLIVSFEDKPCFRFRASDPDTDSQLIFHLTADSLDNMTIRESGTNPKYYEICLKELCSFAGRTLRFPLEVVDTTPCPVMHRAFDTAYVRIKAPPYFEPELKSNVLGSPKTDNDTLVVELDDEQCFTFRLTTDGPTDRLEWNWRTIPAIDRNSVTITTEVVNRGLFITFCWKAGCEGVEKPLQLIINGIYRNLCENPASVADTVFIRVLQPTQPQSILEPEIDRIRYKYSGDTLLIEANDELCFFMNVFDRQPYFRTDLHSTIETADGQPLPANEQIKEISRDTLSPAPDDLEQVRVLRSNLCWKSACKYFDQPLRIVTQVEDFAVCAVEYRLQHVIWVRITQPKNEKPELTSEISVPTNQAGAKTAQVVADTPVCIQFDFDDKAKDSRLFLKVEVLDEQGQVIDGLFPKVNLTQSTRSHIQGEWCWTPSCKYLNQFLTVRITGSDSSLCTLGHELIATHRIQVIQRETFDPELIINFDPFTTDNDIVYFFPQRQNCISIRLQDKLNTGFINQLSLEGQEYLFDGSAREKAKLTPTSGTGIFDSRLCWRPTCSELDQPFPVTLVGTTDPGCAAIRTVTKKFWVKAIDGDNNPPTLTYDLSQLPEILTPSKEWCIPALITDPDTFSILTTEALGQTAEESFGFGSGLRIAKEEGSNKAYTLCFTPNCHIRKQDYVLEFCVYDKSNCKTTLTQCEELTLKLGDCGLNVPNVFTPNGDGINDTFGPMNEEGIQSYHIQMYDRSGQLVFEGQKPVRWDGLANGKEALPGAYFYKFQYERANGTGPNLKSEQSGSVTLLR